MKSEIRQFHVAVVQQRQINVQKKELPVHSCCQSKAEAKRGTFHETNQTWWVKFMKSLTSGSVKIVWMSLGGPTRCIRLLQNRDYGAGLQAD